MTRPTHECLLGPLAFSLALVGIAHAQPTERANPLVLAQAPPLTEQEKAKRKEQERQKGPPPERKEKGPPPKAQTPPTLPPPKNVLTPAPPPPIGKGVEPSMRKATEQPFEKKGPEFKKELPKHQVIPGQPLPPVGPKGPAQGVAPQLPLPPHGRKAQTRPRHALRAAGTDLDPR